MEGQRDKITTKDKKGIDLVVTPQDDNKKSGYQPNWTWGRHDTNYNVRPLQPNQYKYPQKSGWDYFWEFIKIGIFREVCKF